MLKDEQNCSYNDGGDAIPREHGYCFQPYSSGKNQDYSLL